MKTWTLCLVAGVSGIVAAGCTIPDTSDTQCSGHLGCSGRATSAVGVRENTVTVDAGAVVGVGRPATGPINSVLPGAGCGKELPDGHLRATAGTPKGYFQYMVQGTGKTLGADQPAKVGPRTFWVRVPADYDPTHPYRVIYVGQGCGAYNTANNNTLQLYKESVGGSEQAIYVALDIPMDMANLNCYDNRDGILSQEWEAFELFHSVIDDKYCVDNNRIYISGYSTGGWLGNMWGCYFGGEGMNPLSSPGVPRKFASKYHIRAQATVTGGEPANNPVCNGKVAAIWIHDAGDTANEIAGSYAGLKRVGMVNGCNTDIKNLTIQKPFHPEIAVIGDVCKQFTTCPDDYPVVFCTTQGLGHADQHDRAIPAFKQFFDLLEPLPVP